MMDPVASVVDQFKGFTVSTREFINGFMQNQDASSCRNPIEILKRLQREAFSDIMKLRDRQEKVERVLSFYKSTKGNPFQEQDNTRVRGEVDVLGAFSLHQQNFNAVNRAGVRDGINTRFIFETTVRQKDDVAAEFVANQSSLGDGLGNALSLAKVFYKANLSDWCSAIAVPLGGQCRDVAIATTSSNQGKGLTEFSYLGPPLLGQNNGSAVGLTVRRSNIIASIAQFVSRQDMQLPSSSVGSSSYSFSTFGHVVCQWSRGIKLSLMGLLNQIAKSSSLVERETEKENISDGLIALMVESELDESSRIGGWVEMKRSNPKSLQWAVTISDYPEDELGWGLSIGGINQGPMSCEHFQVEASLNFNMSKRFSLQPGIVYVVDRSGQIPALILRSTWSL